MRVLRASQRAPCRPRAESLEVVVQHFDRCGAERSRQLLHWRLRSRRTCKRKEEEWSRSSLLLLLSSKSFLSAASSAPYPVARSPRGQWSCSEGEGRAALFGLVSCMSCMTSFLKCFATTKYPAALLRTWSLESALLRCRHSLGDKPTNVRPAIVRHDHPAARSLAWTWRGTRLK